MRSYLPYDQLSLAVYGVELTTLVKMEGHKVPSVIKDCIEEVENRGQLVVCVAIIMHGQWMMHTMHRIGGRRAVQNVWKEERHSEAKVEV